MFKLTPTWEDCRFSLSGWRLYSNISFVYYRTAATAVKRAVDWLILAISLCVRRPTEDYLVKLSRIILFMLRSDADSIDEPTLIWNRETQTLHHLRLSPSCIGKRRNRRKSTFFTSVFLSLFAWSTNVTLAFRFLVAANESKLTEKTTENDRNHHPIVVGSEMSWCLLISNRTNVQRCRWLISVNHRVGGGDVVAAADIIRRW